jgi:hypothetical protein
MNGHKQTWIKVNAHVDKSLEGLILALNLFPKLQTFESCVGDNNNKPWVNFFYGEYSNHPWKELADFVLGYFGPGIAHMVGDRAEISIRVTESGRIFGELFIRQGAISIVTRAIIKLYREYISS